MATRKPSPAKAAATLRRSEPLPVDVRVTYAAANSLLVLLAGVLLAGAVLWVLRWPGFALRDVQLQGELQRSNLPTLRAHVLPRLQGNFFTVDLQQVRAAFESVPWVRQAVVRRVWPDTLVVHLQEHQPAALWQSARGSAGGDRIVNTHGEVFEAPVSDIEEHLANAPGAAAPGTPAAAAAALPTLVGPEGMAATMLALYQRLAPLLAGMGHQIETLELSERGSWRALMRADASAGEGEGGAVIELGRGDEEQIVARTTQFVRTVGAATGQWRAPLEVADLRHSDGYAVRLRGITVSSAASAAAASKTN